MGAEQDLRRERWPIPAYSHLRVLLHFMTEVVGLVISGPVVKDYLLAVLSSCCRNLQIWKSPCVEARNPGLMKTDLERL